MKGDTEMTQGDPRGGLEIRVQGHLDSSWSEWFDGMTITNVENGEAILSGPVVDQAALQGVLNTTDSWPE